MAYEVWTQEFDYSRQVEIVVTLHREGRPVEYMPFPRWAQIPESPHGLEMLPDDGIWKLRHHDGDALLAAFADAAWKRGWRPKGHQTADTTAQQKHLDDMRAIVAKQLGVTFAGESK